MAAVAESCRRCLYWQQMPAHYRLAAAAAAVALLCEALADDGLSHSVMDDAFVAIKSSSRLHPDDAVQSPAH